MSCFESSTFLKNPFVMNQEVLKKACDELGWKYVLQDGELIVTDVNQKENVRGEYILKLSANTVRYNNYYLKNGKQLVSDLQQHFYKFNVIYAKESILQEFQRVGFAFKKDYDFNPDLDISDQFYMIGYSKMENETEKRTEIKFTILKDGTIITDSNYIPEDIHKLADEAMARLDESFGSQRREGIEIKRKIIPEEYRNKSYCAVNNKIKAKY